MPDLHLIPRADFERVLEADGDPDLRRCRTLADMCRLDALVAVKRAGSGHLGSTFSALDVVAFLLFEELNTARLGWEDPERDVYFSSKGHDVPGLDAALFRARGDPAGALPAPPPPRRARRPSGRRRARDRGQLGLARYGDLERAWNRPGRSAGSVAAAGSSSWWATASCRKARTTRVCRRPRRSGCPGSPSSSTATSCSPTGGRTRSWRWGSSRSRFRAFGWYVASCDGHEPAELRAAFASFRRETERPQALVARDDQGQGRVVHGAPGRAAGRRRDVPLARGGSRRRGVRADLRGARGDRSPKSWRPSARARSRSSESPPLRRPALGTLEAEPESGAGVRPSPSNVTDGVRRRGVWRRARADRGSPATTSSSSTPTSRRTAGCARSSSRSRNASSSAGSPSRTWSRPRPGLARHGLLPVVNSFASFLASRANEQIYNQASERSKVVYALHYAGLIPAGPGKSHQSVRDVSLLGALPEDDDRAARERRRRRARSCAGRSTRRPRTSRSRLAIGPSPRRIELPEDADALVAGTCCGRAHDAVLLAYGPVMLHEALLASELAPERDDCRSRVVAHAVAEPLRRCLARRRAGTVRARSSSSRTILRWAVWPTALRARASRPRRHGLRCRGLAGVRFSG